MVLSMFGWFGCTGGAPATDGAGDAAVAPADAVVVSPTVPDVVPVPHAPKPGEPELGLKADNCEDVKDGGPVAGPGCVTRKVSCGETVVGHTKGGVKQFDSKFYERNQCTPALTNHDGGDERAYLLEIGDGDQHADVWLDTPCADLDLAAMRLGKGPTCPGPADYVPQCDMWPKDGNEREHVTLVSQGGSRWLIVVEGKDEEEGAFALTIACAPGL